MNPKKVKEMSFGERGREIERLRRAIIRFVNLADDAKCHIEHDRLARTVGLKHAARNLITSEKMFRDCKRYINRECRAGRIKGNLITIKV